MSTVLQHITLRPGTAADCDFVDAMMQAAFEPRFGEAWTRSQMLGMLAMPGVWLTIALVDGDAAGFSLCRVAVDAAELLLLAVVPAHRRRGVASALLRAAAFDAGERRATMLHLEVRAGNDAIRLYRLAGFAKVGERRDYYRSADGALYDAYTFSRTLR